jgi:hypothetical protein
MVMNPVDPSDRHKLLRPTDGNRCNPKIVHDPAPRVVDWGMPEDVHAGDFTFSVIEAALSVGASDIQLTPLDESSKASVHFKIGSPFILQAPMTQIQFGIIAIFLAHISNPSSDHDRFVAPDGTPYSLRFFKIRLPDNHTATRIHLNVPDWNRVLV